MKKIIALVLTIVFLSSIPGCNSPGSFPNDIVDIPKENKVELGEIWEIQMDAQQSDYAIEGDKLYVITWNQTIYIIDINTGEIIKNFQLDMEEIEQYEGDYSSGMAVEDGILAINYSQRLVVVDTNTEELLLNHRVEKGWSVAINYDILMHQGLLIYSDIIQNTIYAMNYRTGEIEWQYGGERDEIVKFKLYRYQDKYLYSKSKELAYYEFNPKTGEIIDKYQIESAGPIKNEKQSFYIPIFTNIEDQDFNIWLRNRSFDVFSLSDKGYIFTRHGENFYFHGTEGKLLWKLKFLKNLYMTEPYSKYAILYFNKNGEEKSMSILDLESKEIVWNIDYAIASKPRFFILEDRLFLPGLDGSYKVFDLSVLEQ